MWDPHGPGYTVEPFVTQTIGDDGTTWRTQLADARALGLGPRDFARLTGLAYGTAYNALNGITRNPTAETVRAIERGLEQLPTFTMDRPNTIIAERIRWSGDDLANAEPLGAGRSFQVIFRAADTETGWANSGWVRYRDASPLDVVIGLGGNPNAVTRIVWDKR